ncbi:Ltp family lipoprotein [Gordonia jinghuaiqii]|uniref:Ltp family lipoprotein n=1 Tax=Gordonia jinghuaiqii TaxID=2758710 RepID=UPI0021519B0F|nr:Ltp family lipoprotein [Gordonia jinghuaiqii]
MTSEQLNAVAKAREYSSLMAFSKSGLIEQLEYEGFSYADSAYAVNLPVDFGLTGRLRSRSAGRVEVCRSGSVAARPHK